MTYDQYTAKYPTKKIPRCDSQETVVDVEACSDTKASVVHTEKLDVMAKKKSLETERSDSVVKLDTSWEKDTLQKPPSAVVKS